MNKILVTLLCLLALNSYASEPLFEYGGVFPEERSQKDLISNYFLVQNPGKLIFKIVDTGGKPSGKAIVSEVTLTSATDTSFRNPAGIDSIDIEQPGIYEVKVVPNPAEVGEIGFVLRIFEGGSMEPSVQSMPTVAVKPPESTSKPEVEHQAASNASLIFNKPFEPVPDMEKPAVAKADKPVLIQPLDGYADPFRPVEIRFPTPLPPETDLSRLLHVSLTDASGGEKRVPGRYFASSDLLRFIPEQYINGAVYKARVYDRSSGDLLMDFSFQTFPEVRMNLVKNADSVSVNLNWDPLADLMPTSDGQVVRLNYARLVIGYGSDTSLVFKLHDGLPPLGNHEGLIFRAQPFNFSLDIPISMLQQPAGDDSTLAASLIIGISGNLSDLEVLKTTLKSTTESAKILVDDDLADAPASVENENKPGETPANEFALEPASITEPVPLRPETVEVSSSSVGTGNAVTKQLVTADPVIHEELESLPVVGSISDPGAEVEIAYLRFFKSSEDADSALTSWPRGINWGDDGSLWVVDSQNRRILQFRDDGKMLKAFGEKGRKEGKLGLPIDIALASDGVFISDTAAHCIHHFDYKGRFVGKIGVWGTQAGQMDLPHGLIIDNDRLIVADRGNAQIHKYSLNGVFLGSFGGRGEQQGFFNNPVAVRSYGNRYWTAEAGGRIQSFNADGKSLTAFSTSAREPGSMFLDPWGYIWIIDSASQSVLRYDVKGRLLNTISGPKGFKSWIPTSAAVRKDGILAVSDVQAKAVHLFSVLPKQ